MTQYVEPCLQDHGFQKERKDWFFRFDGDAVWSIASNFRRVRGRDEGWLGVSVCVGFKSLATFLRAFQSITVDDIRPCAMGTDIGHLRPSHRYHEWRLLPDTDVLAVGQEIVHDISTYCREYFERYGSLDKALQAWESGTTYNLGRSVDFYIGAAYWLRGDRERALAFIKDRILYYQACSKEKGHRLDAREVREREAFLEFLQSKEKKEIIGRE